MTLNTWEFSYNGLTFGGDQPHGITTISGLNPPDARIDETERASDHGSFIYAQFLSARTITIEGDVEGTDVSDFDTKITQLKAAFTPQANHLPMLMSVPGGVTKRIYCKPTKVSYPVDINYNLLYATWAVELMAEDPRIYSDASYSSDLMAAIANGIGFNLAFNVNFGGTTGGGLTQTITNQGNFPTLPVVVVYGPAANPVLRNLTTGYSLNLAITLGTTEYLIIDFAARTIVLNDLSSRYSSLLVGSKWWALQPGANTIQFSATGTAGSTKATLSYRDAWN